MTKKITISVPDELHAKMTKWKESFNFSKVFQTTITSMIQKKEEFQKRLKEDLDIAAIAARLKKEKKELEGNFWENGKKFGLEWAKSAHYTEILYALKWNPSGPPTRDEKLGEYFSQITKSEAFAKLFSFNNGIITFNGYYNSFVEGWREGVNEFWLLIRGMLD